MIVRCEPLYPGDDREVCGKVYDDAVCSTICPHYPIGTGPGTFCPRCDLFKPCACDPPKR